MFPLDAVKVNGDTPPEAVKDQTLLTAIVFAVGEMAKALLMLTVLDVVLPMLSVAVIVPEAAGEAAGDRVADGAGEEIGLGGKLTVGSSEASGDGKSESGTSGFGVKPSRYAASCSSKERSSGSATSPARRQELREEAMERPKHFPESTSP